MVSFRNIQSIEDVAEYANQLNTGWPERVDILRHISQQVSELPFSTVSVIELCSGFGLLAETLLRQLPYITYTGVDSSVPLTAYAKKQLGPFGDKDRLILADLNEDDWLNQIPDNVHAIVSMQSLHDLGGEAQVNRIYGIAKTLLVPGGLFLNADLIVPLQEDNLNNPGRLTIPRHLELLQAHGYERISCTLKRGAFGCVGGYAPNAPI